MLRATRRTYTTAPGRNLIEKIVQKYTLDENVKQKDFVSITPHRVMTHDNTAG
jgi:homoaconitate hydratase